MMWHPQEEGVCVCVCVCVDMGEMDGELEINMGSLQKVLG